MSSHDEEKVSNEHPVHGDVNHSSTLCEDIGAIHLSDDYSDVTLIVCGKRFNSHKIILAARSQYFRALLSGGFKESTQQEIELKDASLSGFKGLLEYIYTGRLSLTDRNEEACHEYMDEHAREVMKHESFLQLSPNALNNILSRDSLCAPEIDIFVAVQAWLKANPDADGESILDKIQLSLISVTDLSNVVRDSELFSTEAVLNAIRAQTHTLDPDLNYRCHLLTGVNVAHPSLGAKVLRGETSKYLLDRDMTNYDEKQQYTSHTITDSTEGILVKLGTQRVINHIKMLLWDKNICSYSYYVEVSTNQKNWVRVIDYSNYFCRCCQYLYFDPRAVRYIRIVGTNITGFSKDFRLVSFEAYYTNHAEKHRDGFVIPTQNVATVQQGATVTGFISSQHTILWRCSDPYSVLNGNTSNYDRESGFYQSSYIVVQLGQPYIIDSMRLLLWDLDDTAYSYKIEVSGNSTDWIVIADKTDKYYRSWQTIRFNPPRPVVCVRITGTCGRTDNNDRTVYHFSVNTPYVINM